MPDAYQCPECGAPLPANLPHGLCSRCALLGALELSNGGSQVLRTETLNAPASLALPSAQPGDHIGRYKLLQQIGEGGCGVVFMAEQTEPIRRKIALKIIKLGMDTPYLRVLRKYVRE